MMNPNEPLGLPKGSVRAILALEIVTYCLVYFWVFREFSVPIVSLLFTVTTFYFASRAFPNRVSNEYESDLKDKQIADEK